MKAQMKARWWALLAASLAAGSAGAPARADDSAARKEIEAGYAKFVDGMKKKDIKAIVALATPDFTEKEANGMTMTAKQAEQVLQMQFQMTKSLDSLQMKVESVSVKGKKAVAMVHYSMAGTVADPKGKVHKVTDAGRTRDTWVKTAQGWRIQSLETLSETSTMDGKPVKAPGGSSK